MVELSHPMDEYSFKRLIIDISFDKLLAVSAFFTYTGMDLTAASLITAKIIPLAVSLPWIIMLGSKQSLSLRDSHGTQSWR